MQKQLNVNLEMVWYVEPIKSNALDGKLGEVLLPDVFHAEVVLGQLHILFRHAIHFKEKLAVLRVERVRLEKEQALKSGGT